MTPDRLGTDVRPEVRIRSTNGSAPNGPGRPETAATIHIGGGVNSLNLACSGARTTTFTDSNGYFKPGLDFYNSGGDQGQALMLQSFATTHNVKMVVVSIGGNDFNCASIVRRASPTSSRRRRGGRTTATTTARSPPASPPRTSQPSARASPRRTRTCARPYAMPGTPTARGRCWCRAKSHPSPTAPPSGTASPATPGRAPAAAASGTPMPTGPTPRPCRRSTPRSSAPRATPA